MPPYPVAFRQQTVELVRAGRGITDLARKIGCNANSIHAWTRLPVVLTAVAPPTETHRW